MRVEIGCGCLGILLISGCGLLHNTRAVTRDDTVPGFQISPQQAVALAEPYLDDSFRLRRIARHDEQNHGLWKDTPPRDYIFVRSYMYLISRDNYPSMNLGYYKSHAVRVNGMTGQVIPPS